MSTNQHRYFLDSSHNSREARELPFPKWDHTVGFDYRYAYDVLEAALPHITADGLRFHFTKDAYALPEYGPKVVAVLLQEERCKVPVYGRHVCATIRNLAARPYLACRPHRRLGRLDGLILFEYARDWYTHMKSVRAQRRPPAAWADEVRDDARVISLPLGYHSQEELPQVPMNQRTLDCFFFGQIKHAIKRSDYRHWTSTSKFVARAQLLRELERLQSARRWNIELGDPRAAGTAIPARAYADYSANMMNSRICLAPRGSVADTYRAFEGLRAGCLVVANRLSPDPLLANAPVIQIDHWGELGAILDKYARNIELLESARAASLSWWARHLSPAARGPALAQELNLACATRRLRSD